ncbi:hypothetical protein [Microbacterium hominis]|uniref:Uncharacterized protein n=1 Tax=Microbacterium hominis TaxID=162426 RepID=A0A7D4PMM5_9MICO|nr:hypothetical protein [Microbacterium hominis]QKJ19655.1 hypothetical protein HQM25_09945 [Microbacterium hominis]
MTEKLDQHADASSATDDEVVDPTETAADTAAESEAAGDPPADTPIEAAEEPAEAADPGHEIPEPVAAEEPVTVAEEIAAPVPPAASDDSPGAADDAPQYGVGPFSLREVALGGLWLVAFVVSFFPIFGAIGNGTSVWTSGIDWVLTIGVPTVAVFLIGLRRLSPDGIRRVGSLGIDQFASVAFAVSTVVWLGIIWNSFITLAQNRVFLATWVVWVEFFLMLGGVFLTVFAPWIAPFDEDFAGRREVPAHRNARPVRAVTARPAFVSETAPALRTEPAPEPDAAADPYAATAFGGGASTEGEAAAVPPHEDATQAAGEVDQAWAPEHARDTFEPVETPEEHARHQAFWALAPEERDVVDEVGVPLFRIGPTAWALVIEDRGDTFVVRHEDGRVGYLHDIEGVTRG